MQRLLPKTFKNPQGFTLVELLVVIAIIAVLSVIGMVAYSGLQKNARDAKRKEDINAISKALEAHFNVTGNQYCANSAGTYCALQDSWFALGSIPKDPSTGSDYNGLPSNGASGYTVCATLGDGTQPCSSSGPVCYCVSNAQ